MTNDPIRRSVVASIVASIIVLVFIKPILGLAWRIMNILGNRVSSFISMRIYSNAALGHRNWVDVIILGLFFALLMGIILGSIFILCLDSFFSPSYRQVIRTKLAKLRFILKPIFFSLSLILIVIVLHLTISIFADLQLNTSFQQRLDVLSPYLTELEIKKLRAQWALMKNRSDYEAIVAEVDLLASKYNVNLPRLLLK